MTAVSFTYGDQCQTVDPREFDNFDIGKYRPPVYTFCEVRLFIFDMEGYLWTCQLKLMNTIQNGLV
jgi:hypothetical protein